MVPNVGIVTFEGGKISSEHIYWDQATVLLQLGSLKRAYRRSVPTKRIACLILMRLRTL